MNYYNYFTEIEEHFVRRRGKHLTVSPLDWSLISTWRESGVPLHVAVRGIDIAMDTWHSKPHRITDRPSTLFYCHDAVMAEYARHLEAHLGESSTEPAPSDGELGKAPARNSEDGPDKSTVLMFLGARIHEIESVRAKHSFEEDAEGIDRILSRLAEIRQSVETEGQAELETLERDMGILDELLIAELRRGITQEQFDAWDRDAKKELKVYRKRLPRETYAKIADNYVRGKIHRHFQIGELSLFHI